MKIARLVVYEGSEADIARQLQGSLPEGTTAPGTVQITITAVPEARLAAWLAELAAEAPAP